MFQVIYTSEASDSLGAGDVFKIIETSARNNAPAGLTGFLIYANNRFLQVIEGPQTTIERLMRTLGNDPRHHSIKVMHRAAIAKRSFPKWSMKRIAVTDAHDGIDTLIPELAHAPDVVKRAVEDFLGIGVL
ncbi:BLUF domain-containing protein [Erythrobacter sp. SCSIO 43205]|uniref:BLUF domain-containing protein n=1 Tax=Erythrobacter sp. SCSIO 43205 TaxID=2779361 RepID=UPI001CA934B7|nr:BLUF domain-containing protein [Erythrobacter sp. SCSIO 43205]UAB76800.1 BLUF domain-containing protein [Erythrobacter sp. SCSIO 43205]